MTTTTIRGSGGGKGGGDSRTPVEAADSLRSKQYAHILDLVSEGEIYGLVDGAKSIYIKEVPLQNPDGSMNFKDVHVAWLNGTQTQAGKKILDSAVKMGLDDVRSETLVGTEVLAGVPIVRNISDPNTTYVVVTVGIPTLLSRNASNGDTSGTSVSINIDVQANGGGYVNKISDTITGKTTSRYQRTYTIALTGSAPWNIRVSRSTPDSASQMLVNNTYFDSYTAVIATHLAYPNSAIVSSSIDSQQFQSIPSRAFDIKGILLKVPSNYNPDTRVYSGIWDGTFKIAWSDNPAWVYYDLITNTRYGLGNYINASQVDKWALYTVAQYCDQLVPSGLGDGAVEPRFTCNLYLQTVGEAFDVVQNLASIFRAITLWSAGSLTVVQDSPASAVSLFSNANVVDGAFEYVGSSVKSRHTVALVSWNNPKDFYRLAVEYVADDEAIVKYGYKPTSIVAFGCTSRGQAHRLGKWLLYSEANETEMVTFRAGLDGVSLYCGAIINTSDFLRSSTRMGGRLVSLVGSTAQLDADVMILSGKSYNISIVLEDGSIFNSAISAQVGNARLVSLMSLPPKPPLPNAMFIVAANDLVPEVWRVVSITESDMNTVEVTAIEHAPQKFALIEQGINFTPAPIGVDLTKQKITGISVSESLYVVTRAAFGIKALLSWTSTAARFKLRYRRADGGAWTSVSLIEPSVELSGMSQTAYQFEITAIDGLGRSYDSATYNYTIFGLSIPPANVSGLSAFTEGFGCRLQWDNNADVDLDHYEVRKGGTSWADATPAYSIAANNILLPPTLSGNYTYRVKAVDTTGNYSVSEATLLVTIANPTPVSITAKIAGTDVVLTWEQSGANYIMDHYEVRHGASFGAGTKLDLPYTAMFKERISYGGTRRYWVVAVDVAGNMSAPASVDVTIAAPSPVTITSQVIDNNVLLNWSDSTTTLPIVKYDIVKGVSFALGTAIGDNGNGRFAAFFEQASGLFTYWISATDSAGNTSTPTSIAATVDQPPDYVLRLNYQLDFNGLVYEFGTNGDAQGWIASGASTNTTSNTLTVTSIGTDPIITKQMNSFILYGCEYPTIQIRLRRIAGAGWDGKVLYSTAGHGTSASYYSQTADAAPAIGEMKVLNFNMSALTVGGQDWNTSIINDIRIDLGATVADVFEIDYIRLVPYSISNVALDGGVLYAALSNQTWEQHFTSNGWASPQDQITAGLPYFWEKSANSGYYEEVIDYGSVLSSTAVTATMTSSVILGAVSVVPTISYKLNWGDAWISAVGLASVVATNFRYVKMRYDFASSGGASLLAITNVSLKLSSKTKTDGGSGTANAADSGGTLVNFNIPFIDVTSITVTAQGTTPILGVYDFVDIANPTFFKALLFNATTGVRYTGPFSWTAKGV
jgi:predicted phage tail protein